MKKQAPPHRCQACLLTLILLLAWMARMAHAFWPDNNGHHHERPICEQTGHQKGVHLHDARFHPDDCSLCAFTLAKADVPHLFDWALSFAPLPETQLQTTGPLFRPVRTAADCLRRGPPALFFSKPV